MTAPVYGILVMLAAAALVISGVVCHRGVRRAWHRATSRVAVEIVRLKTGHPVLAYRWWLTDARLWLVDVVRGRGRGAGLHVLPAGEPIELPYQYTSIPRRVTQSQPPVELFGEPLTPLPLIPDRVDDFLTELETTGTITEGAERWNASTAVSGSTLAPAVEPLVLAGATPGLGVATGVTRAPASSTTERSGRSQPTDNQRAGYWEARDTAVDASLLAAIREHIDGIEHSHQYVDRLFSQIDLRQIFDRALAGVSQ